MPRDALPLLDDLVPLLRTARFGRVARGFQVVDSTNSEAAAWAADGAPDGALVAADFQSRGRGRLGRAWQAPAGLNLTFSLVLRPPFGSADAGLLPLAAALGVAEAVEPFVTPSSVSIKWPNDVLVDGRKACGLLLEAATAGPRAAPIILGAGLNVNQTTFDPEHAERATSLALAAGRPLPRAVVLAAVLARLEAAVDALARDPSAVLRRYDGHLAGRGAQLTLHATTGAPPVTGVLLGVTAAGGLRLRTDAGERVFYAGDVSSRPPLPSPG